MKRVTRKQTVRAVLLGILAGVAIFTVPLPVKRAVDVELAAGTTDAVFSELAGQKVTLLCAGNVRHDEQTTMTMEEVREEFWLQMTDSCNGYDVLAIQNEAGIFEPLRDAGGYGTERNERKDAAGKRIRIDIEPDNFVGSALQSYHIWYLPGRNRFIVTGTLKAEGRHGYTLDLDSWEIAYPVHHLCLAEETEYYQRHVFLFDYLRNRFFWLRLDEMPPGW